MVDEMYLPVNTLSGHTLQVRRDSLQSWNVSWNSMPVASIRFRSDSNMIVETSLGRYHLRKVFDDHDRLTLIHLDSGTELASGRLSDRGMQMSFDIRGSEGEYLLKWLRSEDRWILEVADGQGEPVMRLRDFGHTGEWEAEIELYFSKSQSTQVHMLLASLVSYWMQNILQTS